MIRIHPFEEWTCDTHYAPVAVGQKLVLFLKIQNNTFTLINGSTGEMPVTHNQVTLNHKAYGDKPYSIPSYTIHLTAFTQGIRMLARFFEIQQQSGEQRTVSIL